MTLEENIKEWAKITESQINEVSDIDVDWDDETLNDKTVQDFVDASKRYNDMDMKDLSYLTYFFEQCLDMDKVESWIEYWKTHEPVNKKAYDYIVSRLKAKNSIGNTSNIQKVKREEGL